MRQLVILIGYIDYYCQLVVWIDCVDYYVSIGRIDRLYLKYEINEVNGFVNGRFVIMKWFVIGLLVLKVR